MHFPPHTSNSIEVEAKFLGGEEEFDKIMALLESESFAVERRSPVHRMHIYFEDEGKLLASGYRLRCVVAAGEWCRYDFKADDPSGRGETTEVSLKLVQPIAIKEAVKQLSKSLPMGAMQTALLEIQESAKVILVMTGLHRKADLQRPGLELEVTWDTLVPVTSGAIISEIEVELVAGERKAFDSTILSLHTALHLTQSNVSKLERALAE